MTSSSALVGESFFGLDLKKIQTRWTRFRRRVSKRILLIDFDATSVTLAEVQIQTEALSFDHVRRYPLPEEALERGVPAEPAKMAALIRGYCQDANIPAHRAAVVLPHDAVFTTVVQLPRSVPPAMALDHALDPASAVQVPIQLDQMDADLLPLSTEADAGDQRSYFLTAVPRKLVDRVLDTLQAADLEMVRLQVGVFAQLQHLAGSLQTLAPGTGLLHLELLRDCTQATVLCASGPIKLARLTAIRDFPEPPEPSESAAATSVLNAEAQIIASDGYLPISDLDLRRLTQEIRQFIDECHTQYPSLALGEVLLAGVNSAHPLLASLLQDALGLPVQVSRPLATAGVGQFTPDAPMVLQGLGRLVGLGLSLMPPSVSPTLDQVVDLAPPLVDEAVLTPSLPDPEEAAVSIESVEPPEELVFMLTTPEVDSAPVKAQIQPPLQPAPERSPELLPMAELKLTLEPEDAPSADSTPQSEALPLESAIFTLDALDLGDVGTQQSLDQPQPEPLLVEPEPPDAPDELPPDQVEVPFSLGDLLSSYEAKAAAQLQPLVDELPVIEDDVHLVDDPSLWPSITKVDVDSQPEEVKDDNLSLG